MDSINFDSRAYMLKRQNNERGQLQMRGKKVAIDKIILFDTPINPLKNYFIAALI